MFINCYKNNYFTDLCCYTKGGNIDTDWSKFIYIDRI